MMRPPPGPIQLGMSVGPGRVIARWDGFRLTNPLNGSRGHWAVHAGRARAHRAMGVVLAGPLLRAGITARTPDGVALAVARVRVDMHREGPRGFDDDNLLGAFKAIRDGVADQLGVDDRDPRIVWHYAQRRASFAVIVVVSSG